MDNRSAGWQPLKKAPLDLHPNKRYIWAWEAAVTDWRDGVQVSPAPPSPGMLCIPAGIWKQDAWLSPASRARNVSYLQVFPARRQADNFYFTLTCELGRASHQQLCFGGREASPCPSLGMFNIPAHMWCVHGTYTWTNTCGKKIVFPFFIHSLQKKLI